MVRLTALYPSGDDVTFDHDYYETRHLAVVQQHFAAHGLKRVELDRGVAGFAGAAAPFIASGQLVFESLEQLQGALAAHGDAVLGDIPNFTNVQPVVQISKVGIVAGAAVDADPLSAG